MQIKIDEDLPKRVATLLRKHGYETSSVVEQGIAGWKDAELWHKIQSDY